MQLNEYDCNAYLGLVCQSNNYCINLSLVKCFNMKCNILSFITDEDDDVGDVMDYLSIVAGDWQAVCKKLHVKSSRIREFNTNYGHDSGRCMDSAIADWLSLNYNHAKFGKPTWRKVAESVFTANQKLFLKVAAEHITGGADHLYTKIE